MKNSYLAIGGVVVLLVLGGLGFLFRHELKQLVMPSAAPVQQTPPTETANSVTPTPPESTPTPVAVKFVTVEYTAAGFAPKTVTIKKGEMVKFINKSGNPMDVASSPHPLHTDYPEFDQGKSAFSGKDEYDFTFEKVGTWGYHNHLNPRDKGTVVVTE